MAVPSKDWARIMADLVLYQAGKLTPQELRATLETYDADQASDEQREEWLRAWEPVKDQWRKGDRR